MKLSDIKGERVMEVIADTIEPICNIAQDEDAAKLFKKERLPEGMTARDFTLNRWKKCVPKLMKNHKRDLIEILSAIDGTSADEYTERLNLVSFMADCVSLLSDPVFTQLFLSQAQTTNTCGSATATSEDTQ